MFGGVTRHMLPHLSGVPHLYLNGPLVNTFCTNNMVELNLCSLETYYVT